tara:strand:+ start:520 stop:1161 length:642 start_codon:yes stop_codon:yes gene_type:complete
MTVLIYQIGIFIAVQVAAVFGKSSRNTALILITIFTLLQVFMSWLLILQLITIFISYQFSKKILSNNSSNNQPNKKTPKNALYSYRDEYGGRVVTEVDLNDETIDRITREKAILQNEIREKSIRKYDSDTEYKSLIDNVINNMVSGKVGGTNGISLNTKFYYIERGNIRGPVTGKKLISLVKDQRIDKNCFVRQTTENRFEKRAYEIVELLEK